MGMPLLSPLSPFAPVANEGPFGAILADPPWSYANFSAKGEAKNPKAHYGCMSLADIAALPVADIAAKDCALIMWATAPMMPEAFTVMDRWGFRFSTMGAWAKQSKTGAKWAFGTGYVLRSAAEFWLIGVRGKPRVKVRNVRNLLVAPVREHSRKPEEIRSTVERLFDGPYLELFARTRAPGWSAWGNETDKFTEPNPSPTVTAVTPQASHRSSHLSFSRGYMSHPPSHPVTPPRHADASPVTPEDRRAIIPAEGEELPPPLVPADFDPKNGTNAAFSIEEGKRIAKSDMTPGELRAAMVLQTECWLQKPCGSLPNDNVEIANLIGDVLPGWDLDAWLRVKSGALNGWQLCSDNRLYNPAIAKCVLEFPEIYGDCR